MHIGESFVGQGLNAAHINTVFGHREGPVGVSWATALATPSEGHVPFVAVLQPSMPVKPLTLFVTKVAPVNDSHGNYIWGAAQAGVAAGVADAVADGIIESEWTESHVVIAAVWVNAEANDAHCVFENNRQATHAALSNGMNSAPALESVLAARQNPHNPFFTPS